MIRADLHLHSNASDGVLTPRALMERAAREGWTTAALTDHDCTDGMAEAREAAQRLGITLIAGVELSCGCGREVHMLGYGIDPDNEALTAFCGERVRQRRQRAERILTKLADCGLVLDMRRVEAIARGVIARPHIARALVECGYAATTAEAFERYLGDGRCADVPKADVPVRDAIDVIRGAGGVPVLAHPMQLKMGDMALEAMLDAWKEQGLAGIEVYHPSAANHRAAYLKRQADSRGMLTTGGSDFHGEAVRDTAIGEGLVRWTTMEKDVQRLKTMLHMD